jgi:glycosyltransferase involved in cell wall biosynthesis
MLTPEISIVVPVYNEKENLSLLVSEIKKALSPFFSFYEIILVDDGSHDGSQKEIQKLSQNNVEVCGVFLRVNAGQSAAMDAGLRAARAQIIATLDADLQNVPGDIPRMVGLLADGYDVVTGWRKNRKDGLFLRKLPSRLANRMIRFVTKTKTHDLGCSLRVYRKKIIEDLRLYGEMHRFIVPLLESKGAKVVETEVDHRPRHLGKSKYNLGRTFKVMIDLMTVKFLQSYRSKPSYVFGGLGLILLGFTSIVLSYVLYQKLFLGIWVHRNPLFLIASFSSIVGVQFISLGLLSEILIRTYFESSAQLPYTVDKTVGFESSPN